MHLAEPHTLRPTESSYSRWVELLESVHLLCVSRFYTVRTCKQIQILV